MADYEKRELWPGWKTVRLIGRGSFGGVYEIERDVFGHIEKAALKVMTIPQNESDVEELRDSGLDDESITATLKTHVKGIVNEYSLMREMNGASNIVSCDDFSIVARDSGIGWDILIKMELLTPLTKSLGNQMTENQLRKLAADICNALILCRKNNIIHRDIKPQNIFISKNGDYKLGDFGIAKTMEGTSSGTKTGTYRYMAPEVFYDRPYNNTVDIYSLGLVLHWLMNQRRSPFVPLPPALPSVADEDAARRRRLNGDPIPAPAHGSEDFKRIVLKACAYDSKDRYQTPEEMLEDIKALEKSKDPDHSFYVDSIELFTQDYSSQSVSEREYSKPASPAPDSNLQSQNVKDRLYRTSEGKNEANKALGGSRKTDHGIYFENAKPFTQDDDSQPVQKRDYSKPAVHVRSNNKQNMDNADRNYRNSGHGKENIKQNLIFIVPMAVFIVVILVVIVSMVLIKNLSYDDDNWNNMYDSENQTVNEYSENYELEVSNYSQVEIGDYIVFGQYEQDNDTSNGKEEIRWLVLAKEDDRILVISDKALDCQPYNTSWTDVTWESCTLREWLNGTFLDTAFSAEEQAMIQSTKVSADKNPNYSTDPGNATTDKVFLLSINEVNEYFSSDEARKCVPTEYAIAQGAWTDSDYTKGGKATCWWWLRSPSGLQLAAADVYSDGSVDSYGFSVISGGGCVRPALWINLES